MKKRRKKIFTLIELLVVIAIIAILVALLLPALRKARDTAQGISCISNMKSFSFGFFSYADNNDGYFPGYQIKLDGSGTDLVKNYNWWLSHVMLELKLLEANKANKSWLPAKGIFKCGSNPKRGGSNGMGSNYTYNSELGYDRAASIAATYGKVSAKPRSWKRQTQILISTDGGWYNFTDSNSDRNHTETGYGYNRQFYAGFIHNQRTNALFLDGHAVPIAPAPGSSPLTPYLTYATANGHFVEGLLAYGKY